MTLWLDSGTVRSEYVEIAEGDEGRVEFRERVVDGRPRVEVVVPAGVGFDVDVEGFVREFSGCEPSLEVEGSDGVGAVTGEWLLNEWGSEFQPSEECTVVFSASEDATGLQFDGE